MTTGTFRTQKSDNKISPDGREDRVQYLLAPHAVGYLHFYSGAKGSGSDCLRCSFSHSGPPCHKGSRHSIPICTLPCASVHIGHTLGSYYYYPHFPDCSSSGKDSFVDLGQ
ncbi:hypothetical protein TIFTF001_029041 [Ficus carica]|uniref:Uncharacterized protein n=1 Tax=Ficus carica TaxID=3494 RepID=A0AA88DQV1_FICCA|nr:hypothetical protein TIFTF001_029041 [Ficus carica]